MLYDGLAVLALLILATALAMLLGYREATAGRDPLLTAWLLIVWFLYLALCWRYGGMTVGMRAWRVTIVQDDLQRPGWGRCGLRFAASLISAAALGLGFAWSLVDTRKRTWHDMASHTRLVHNPRKVG